MYTLVFDSIAIKLYLCWIMMALDPSGPTAYFWLLLATMRPWEIGNRIVSQVQRKSSCSNNVAKVAKSLQLMCFKIWSSSVSISHNYCCRDRWMLTSQITRVIESLARLIDTDFIHKSMKSYIMFPDMASLLSLFSLYSKLFCTRGYFKSYVRQSTITWYEFVLSLGQESTLLNIVFVSCCNCLLWGQPGLVKVRYGDCGRSRKWPVLLGAGKIMGWSLCWHGINSVGWETMWMVQAPISREGKND